MAQKFTTERIISALHATNGMVYLAARKVGCNPQTIYNRAKQTKAVRQAIDDSRGELVDLAEQKMRLAVLAGEPWALALVLRTLGKTRGYVERQEVTGENGGPIETKSDGTTDEERIVRIMALLERARARRDRQATDGDS